VKRLMAARDTPLVVVVAPAGYGKTTLLREWSERDRRPFAWVALREADNEPSALLRSLGEALLDAELVDDETVARLDAESSGPEAMNDICAAVATRDGGIVLVLDGAHLIDRAECLELLSQLVELLGAAGQVVLASRTEPRLGLAGLRALRKVLELRSADLAMTGSEAAALLAAQGLELDRRALELLVHRTEGWPAGLYLAGLAAREEPNPVRALARFAGDDRFMADYIADEVLAPLPANLVAFLTRSSVLDSVSGPLCDFVLDRADSARLLKTLSRMNPMLVPLDRSDTEYRYHRLFAQALRAELSRREPGAATALHSRASVWYGEHGDAERSIEHAVAAGDVQLAGESLWSHSAGILGSGRLTELRGWLGRFSDEQLAAQPTLALAAAAGSLVAGERSRVERWTSLALRGLDGDEPGAVAGPLRAEVLLVRAAVADDRVGRMGEFAEAACADAPGDSSWLALGHLLHGVAHHLTGEREPARRLLEEGARHAAAGFPSMQSLCLAQLCLLAIERGDWPAAESLSARAKAQVERSGIRRYPTSALVYAVSADVQAHVGRVEACQADAGTAAELLAGLSDFSPWYEGECRIALARAALRVGDVPRARALLADAARDLERSPDATVALGWIEACRAQADLSTASAAGERWCLTTAELRILQFLPTHLSFPDVADRLCVSANTVKTHARSVYRKLGASSRAEAVARAREAGLLDEASHIGARALSPVEGGDDLFNEQAPSGISPDPRDAHAGM
jgi:LuxR family transcriptional regulator, maltose regulon positive regulatory protein